MQRVAHLGRIPQPIVVAVGLQRVRANLHLYDIRQRIRIVITIIGHVVARHGRVRLAGIHLAVVAKILHAIGQSAAIAIGHPRQGPRRRVLVGHKGRRRQRSGLSKRQSFKC